MNLQITEEWDGETFWNQEELVAFAPELTVVAEMDCGEDCDCEDCMEDKSVGNCPKCGSNSYSMRDKMPEEGYTTCSKCGEKNKTSDWYKTSKSEVEVEIEIKPEGECECESPELQESEGKKSCAKCGKKMKDSMAQLADIDKKFTTVALDLSKSLTEISKTESISTVITNKKPNKTMLTAIADINDEYLKTAQATEIREFLEKCAAESATKAAEQLKAIETEKGSIAADLEKAKTELAAAKAELEKLNQEKSAAAAQELFNKRMAYFDEKFELCEDAKKAIVARLNDIKDEEAFAAYQKEMDIFLKGKEKGQKQVVASVQNDDKALDTALKNAEAQKVEVLPGQVKDQPKSLYDKFKKAFELNSENFVSR